MKHTLPFQLEALSTNPERATEQSEKIAHYLHLLKEYNETTNVYSKSAYDKLSFHVQDSVNIANLIPQKSKFILDMGSGSGLPAIIIAIIKPQITIWAVESKSRKTTLLTQVKTALNLHNLTIHTQDIHQLIREAKPKPDIITAKAFKPIPDVITLAQKFPTKPTLIIPISETQAQTLPTKKLKQIPLTTHTYTYYLSK